MTNFSDYIVYVDESGDHGMTSIDKEYPIFSLAFILVKKTDYIEKIVPAIQAFKFKYFGHDTVVLHEHEIRKQRGDFAFLRTSQELRHVFLEELSNIIESTPFEIIASVIRKDDYSSRSKVPDSPYEIALLFCLERLHEKLQKLGQLEKNIHIVFEQRGKVEDKDLELYFRRIVDGEQSWGYRTTDFSKNSYIPVFRSKYANSAGVQIADLTARPIGLSVLRPTQSNRAYDVISDKVQRKCFP